MNLYVVEWSDPDHRPDRWHQVSDPASGIDAAELLLHRRAWDDPFWNHRLRDITWGREPVVLDERPARAPKPRFLGNQPVMMDPKNKDIWPLPSGRGVVIDRHWSMYRKEWRYEVEGTTPNDRGIRTNYWESELVHPALGQR